MVNILNNCIKLIGRSEEGLDHKTSSPRTRLMLRLNWTARYIVCLTVSVLILLTFLSPTSFCRLPLTFLPRAIVRLHTLGMSHTVMVESNIKLIPTPSVIFSKQCFKGSRLQFLISVGQPTRALSHCTQTAFLRSNTTVTTRRKSNLTAPL